MIKNACCLQDLIAQAAIYTHESMYPSSGSAPLLLPFSYGSEVSIAKGPIYYKKMSLCKNKLKEEGQKNI